MTVTSDLSLYQLSRTIRSRLPDKVVFEPRLLIPLIHYLLMPAFWNLFVTKAPNHIIVCVFAFPDIESLVTQSIFKATNHLLSSTQVPNQTRKIQNLYLTQSSSRNLVLSTPVVNRLVQISLTKIQFSSHKKQN